MKKRLLALMMAFALTGCALKQGDSPAPEENAAPSFSLPPTSVAPSANHPFALACDPQRSWDPYGSGSSPNLPLLGLIGEGLYQLDTSFEPVPALAASSHSEDGLVWHIELQEGVVFSDGAPFDAPTAAKLIDAARGEKSIYNTRLREVTGVTPAGELTLEITLSKANRNFPALLDFPLVRIENKLPVDTGPYLLQVGEDGGMALLPSPTWWRGQSLPIQEISLAAGADTQSLMNALDEGRVAFAPTDLAGQEGLAPAGECKSQDYPTSTMLYLGFRRDGGPCKDARFCRALSQSIDRAALVSEPLGGHGAVAALPTPPSSRRYDRAQAAALTCDLPAAQAALDELGYSIHEEDGLRYQKKSPLTLTLVANGSNSVHRELAQRIAKDLEAQGLTVTVYLLEKKEYLKSLENKNFDLYLGECRLTADGDLTPFFTRGSGLCFAPGSAEALLSAAEEAKAAGTWSQFFAAFTGDPPFAPLCFKNGSVLIQRDRVTGAVPTQGNLFYRFQDWRVK